MQTVTLFTDICFTCGSEKIEAAGFGDPTNQKWGEEVRVGVGWGEFPTKKYQRAFPIHNRRLGSWIPRLENKLKAEMMISFNKRDPVQTERRGAAGVEIISLCVGR